MWPDSDLDQLETSEDRSYALGSQQMATRGGGGGIPTGKKGGIPTGKKSEILMSICKRIGMQTTVYSFLIKMDVDSM